MAQHPYPQRKKIRLDERSYADLSSICSVSVCTIGRAPVFQNPGFAGACIALLRSRSEATCVAIHAYCFMPDHLHLLISSSPDTSILDFVRDVKSRSTRLAWQHGFKGSIWQARYYDHFLRREENLYTAVHYILNNPVRKGLVEEWKRYPFCGSLVYEL